jgi:hypothetical protein
LLGTAFRLKTALPSLSGLFDTKRKRVDEAKCLSALGVFSECSCPSDESADCLRCGAKLFSEFGRVCVSFDNAAPLPVNGGMCVGVYPSGKQLRGFPIAFKYRHRFQACDVIHAVLILRDCRD